MRILLFFIVGLFSFFYISELVNRLFKKPLPSLIGLLFILSGTLAILFGANLLYSPMNILAGVFLLGSGFGLSLYHLLTRRYFFSEKIELNFIRKHKNWLERALEILPGAVTWVALTSPFWLSLTLPFAVAYLVILADIYWLINAVKTAVFIFIGYRNIEHAKKQPWLNKLQSDFPSEWKNYYHLLLVPTYKESLQVLAPAFDAIAGSSYPKNKIFLAVGFEERDDLQKIEETTKYLKQYSEKIAGVFTTTHPFGLTGEVPGAGSNRNWMVKNAMVELEKLKIKPEQVIVTTLDADFVIHREFLAGALHKYLSTPATIRDKRTYTGAFFYYNNYWQTPAPMRILAIGTAFWQLSEMVLSDKYQNFSSFSINMQALLDIGLWMPDKVNDDSGFYWKAYFHFKGDYRVIPHYLPINADAVLDAGLFKTFQNQYLQLKRWAYGVEHTPYVVKQYFNRTDIDFWDKTDKLLFMLWGHLRWAILALFVTFGGLLIPVLSPDYKQSVVAVNLPIVSSWILTAAFLGLFSTVFVHEKTVPQRPKKWGLFKRVWSYVQFLLVPIAVVTLSTLPAIDAQTSLMFGKKLEFRVTNKARIRA